MTIDVTEKPSGDSVISDTLEIESEDSHEYKNVLEHEIEYAAEVSIDGGQEESTEWINRDGKRLDILFNEDGIEFMQVTK